MDDPYIQLTTWQVAVAALLIAFNGVVSVGLRLGLERLLLMASLRTIAQLLLVGLILQWVFSLSGWYTVLALGGAMTLIAGISAARRSRRHYRGVFLNSVISVWASSWLIGGIALTAIVQVDPWYRPQYAIPLLGMILGNTLTGVSLGLDRLTEQLSQQRARVETMLALGATRWEAAIGPIQNAMRTGMVPIINSMMVVGIVSLPGMMTGQLLSGVDPIDAVKYQIVIMFLIASGTGLGTMGVVLLSYRRLFNARHQFQYWFIRDSDQDGP